MHNFPPVTVTSGPAEIVASGLAISFKGNAIELTNSGLTFIFTFVTNAKVVGQNLQLDVLNPKTIKLTLTNFTNSLGTGTTEPLEIGTATVGERQVKIHLHFRVYSLGQTDDKTLQYCVYQVPEGSQNA